MPRRVLVIDGHPDGGGKRYCHALADAYADGAREGGYEVDRLVVGQLDFPLLRRNEDFDGGTPPATILKAQEQIRAADHLVLVFPLWLGSMPALLKGFIEQAFSHGFALKANEKGGMPHRQLKGKSARLIVTMGMPALFYRWFYRAHSLKSLERNILGFAGISPVKSLVIGRVDAIGAAGRDDWLKRVHKLGRKAG
jgi:putative NADPH-quinone reductase